MRETLLKLSEDIHLKAALAYVMVLLSWAFNGETQMLMAVGSLIFIDTLTGVITVLSLQGLAGYKSREFSRVMGKVFRYLIFMYVARVVDKGLPIHIFSPIMDTFIVTTEATSILENFAKLGYPVPTYFLDKLKKLTQKKAE